MSAPHRYSDEPGFAIDLSKIPAEFQHLVELAKEWSIGDDAELEDYMATQPREKLSAVAAAFAPHFSALQKWSEANSAMVPQPDEIVLFDTATAAVATVFAMLR